MAMEAQPAKQLEIGVQYIVKEKTVGMGYVSWILQNMQLPWNNIHTKRPTVAVYRTRIMPIVLQKVSKYDGQSWKVLRAISGNDVKEL